MNTLSLPAFYLALKGKRVHAGTAGESSYTAQDTMLYKMPILSVMADVILLLQPEHVD